MKAFKIITHPVVLICSFLFILISGEHFGGFYLLYLLLALPHGSIHALLGLAGIILLLFTYFKFSRAQKFVIELVLNLLGTGCLLSSLFLFFFNDRQGYNSGTIEELVPQITLALFGLLTIGFIVSNFVRSGNKPVNGNLSVNKI